MATRAPTHPSRLPPSFFIVQPRLSELLGQAVEKAEDCIGEAVTSKLATMKNGSVSAAAAGGAPAAPASLCCRRCCRLLSAATPNPLPLPSRPSPLLQL